MTPIDSALSRKLRALSLLGIAMIVWSHSPTYRSPDAPSQRSWLYQWIEYYLTDSICRAAVALFFCISGYLFFLGLSPTVADLAQKFRRRARSLLLPYVLWSALAIALFALLQTVPSLQPHFRNPTQRIAELDAWGLLELWLIRPIQYPFWFLRDLIFLVLVSPLLLLGYRALGAALLLLLFVPWWFGFELPLLGETAWLGMDGLFFFALGGYLAYRRIDVTKASRGRTILALAFLAVLVPSTQATLHGGFAALPWYKLGLLLGVGFYWTSYPVCFMWLERSPFDSLTRYTFFLYAGHEPLLAMIKKPLERVLGVGDFAHAAVCVLSASATIVLLLLFAAAMRRIWPAMFYQLSGGRGA